MLVNLIDTYEGTISWSNPSVIVSDSTINFYVGDANSLKKLNIDFSLWSYSASNIVGSPCKYYLSFFGHSYYIALSATGNVDGIGLLARLSNVKGIVVDSADTYAYICDYGNNKIRRVDLSNSSYPVITVASGISGCWGLSIDKSKNSLFAVASKSHVVYKVAISNPLLYPISPTTNNIIAGQYG